MICLGCGQQIGLMHICRPPIKLTEPLVDRARRALAKHEAGYELIVDQDLLLAALQTYVKVHS